MKLLVGVGMYMAEVKRRVAMRVLVSRSYASVRWRDKGILGVALSTEVGHREGMRRFRK